FEFFLLLNSLVEQRKGYWTEIFCVAVLLPSICFIVSYPLLILPVLAVMVWGSRAIHASVLRSVLKELPPEVAVYYHAARPLYKREEGAAVRRGCGFFLGVAAVITLIVQLTMRRLWGPALQLALVGALGGPWLWRRFIPPRARGRTDRVEFRFPDDPP